MSRAKARSAARVLPNPVALLDLKPTLEIRLEGARELYVQCCERFETRDYNCMAEACRRADAILYPRDDSTHGYPRTPKITAFYLYEFLKEHGIDAFALQRAES